MIRPPSPPPPPPFFDTDILLYSISRDVADIEKRERAIAMPEGDDGALSVQVLQEFMCRRRVPPGPIGWATRWLRG